ncbi:hypothetical protein [Clostridium gasigenes]|nr:hypothetical protein [Clostridium gasigenes]MBU3109352.1 hypothetical protein [Clostridium gasigenes]
MALLEFIESIYKININNYKEGIDLLCQKELLEKELLLGTIVSMKLEIK